MTAQPQVLVDGRVISHPTAGGRGIGRYTIGLVRVARIGCNRDGDELVTSR